MLDTGKIQNVLGRLASVESDLSDPSVLSDAKRYRATLRDHAFLKKLEANFAAYTKALSDISVDIMFFSSQSLSIDGMISDSTEEENYVRSVMLERANKTVFLCDSTKFNTKSLYTLSSLDCIDYAVFDRDFEGLVTKATVI